MATRKPSKSAVKTRNFRPLGRDVEVTVWNGIFGGMFTFPLEDWQVYAVQKILGIEPCEDGTITMFSKEFVIQQLERIKGWQIVEKEIKLEEVEPDADDQDGKDRENPA